MRRMDWREICWKGLALSLFLVFTAFALSRQKAEKTDAPAKETNECGNKELPMEIALTFDDGPHSVYTPMLLDGLRERNVRASFFLIGKNIEGKEEIVRRMAKEGHLIGNHTYSHVRLTNLNTYDACRELQKTSRLIEDVAGISTEFMRPPFGEWEKGLENDMGMFPVLWNVDTRDWTTKNVSDIVRRGCEGIREGSIILMHDCYESSVTAALAIVDELKGRGYEFVTVEELLLE